MIDYLFEKIKNEMTKRGKAESIVKNSVIWAGGAGLIPIPLADMVAVTAIQVDMLKQVAAVYGENSSENQLKSWVSALSGSVASRLGAEALKIIPGFGSVLGGVSMAVLSGATTYATGQVFIDHFEKGGTLATFDAESVKDFYKAQFEKGKSYVEDLAKDFDSEKAKRKAENSDEKSGANQDVFGKLQELNQMLQKGLITEEEFKKLKKKLMEE